MMRAICVCVAMLAPLGAQGGASFATAVADYRAGRHQAAFDTFQREFAAAGAAAGAPLRWNLALAALRVQRSSDAEAAVQPWLASDDAALRADAEFVLAMASFQRGERAAAAAQLADAEPMAWTMAVQAMERATAGFLRAANARGGWPEAERNAERARARHRELQQLRAAAQAPPAQPEPQPPEPLPPPERPAEPQPEEAALGLTKDPLAAAELANVWRRVDQKEREKRTQRQQQQRRAMRAGERGW